MQNFTNGYYQVCLWIMRLVYINLLWVLFSVAGLVVFGFLPATVGMFAVIRKWVEGKQDIPIFGVFWKTYRTEFLKANLLGYVLLIIGYILYLDLQFFRMQEALIYQFASYVIIGLFFLYFIILLYIYPLFVHFETKLIQYIKWAIVIGITHPFLTIMMATGIIISNYIFFMLLPPLIIFFGGSIPTYLLMWGAFRTFSDFQLMKSMSS